MPYIVCSACDKEFHISPSRLGIRKTCSKKCYSAHMTGRKPWNKGQTKESDARVAKYAQTQSITRKGIKHGHLTGFVKGVPSWNAGTAKPKIARPKYEGERHWKWAGGITKETKLERTKFLKYHVPKILKRDNYTCFDCNKRGGCLHVDHIKSWAKFPELRFDYNNCRTVCKRCHYKITFGRDMPDDSKWGLSSIPYDLGE